VVAGGQNYRTSSIAKEGASIFVMVINKSCHVVAANNQNFVDVS